MTNLPGTEIQKNLPYSVNYYVTANNRIWLNYMIFSDDCDCYTGYVLRYVT